MLATLLLLSASFQDPRPQPLPLLAATPQVATEPKYFTLSAGDWVAREGGPASMHRAPNTLLYRQFADEPEEPLGSMGGRLLDLRADGTVLVSGRARNHVSVIDPAGNRQEFRAPGALEGERVAFTQIDLSGAILKTEQGDAASYHFRTFGTQGFGPAIPLAEGDAAKVTRDRFWREGRTVAWITEGNQLHVVDTAGQERWHHPLPTNDRHALSGVFEGVALLAASSPDRVVLLRLSDGASWTIHTPRRVDAVLPDGILMVGMFWDPVTDVRRHLEVPNLGSYRSAISRVASGTYDLVGPRQVWTLDVTRTTTSEPANDPEVLARLEAGLAASNSEETFLAIQSLRTPLGPRELALLQQALAAGGPNVVSRAANLLGWDGGGASLRLMIDALGALGEGYHPDRHRLAFALAESGDPLALEALLQMPVDGFLARNDDGERLARALGMHALPEAAELLRRIRPGAVPEVDAALTAIAERPEVLKVWAGLR